MRQVVGRVFARFETDDARHGIADADLTPSIEPLEGRVGTGMTADTK